MAEQKETKALSPMQRFNATITSDTMQAYIQQVIGEKRQTFTNNVVALVSNNSLLQNCKPMTVVYAALKATALGLPLDPALGQAWVIPYGDQAQFQMGAKGFVQLALRSGKFDRLNVTEVREGELKENNILTGDIVIEAVPNRSSRKIIGYAAYFRLVNGQTKTIYKSKEEIQAHAKKFSKSYNSGPWKDHFDAMATKTILKELLSKWAPLSVEDAALAEAIRYDQSVIDEQDGAPVYVDAFTQEERNENTVAEKKAEMKAEGKGPQEML